MSCCEHVGHSAKSIQITILQSVLENPFNAFEKRIHGIKQHDKSPTRFIMFILKCGQPHPTHPPRVTVYNAACCRYIYQYNGEFGCEMCDSRSPAWVSQSLNVVHFVCYAISCMFQMSNKYGCHLSPRLCMRVPS